MRPARVRAGGSAGAGVLGVVIPATFIAGAFVLTQRVAQVVWQPFAGRFADRAIDATFFAAAIVVAAGVGALTLPLDAVTFVVAGGAAYFAGLNGAIVAELAVARLAASADRPRVLAAFHTAQDAGAAAGAVPGGAVAAARARLAPAGGGAPV